MSATLVADLATALLCEPSPLFRSRVLVDLLDQPTDDPEVLELSAWFERDPLIADLRRTAKEIASLDTRALVLEIRRLGYLGFDRSFDLVSLRAEELFSRQCDDGSWPIEGTGEREDGLGYTMIPLQTALPLHALASAGCATDDRAERAYDWLFAQRLEDGSWPAGRSGGVYGRIAGYRRIPQSRWGCRSNTTGALYALAFHPEHRNSQAAHTALDLVLGRNTLEESSIGFEVARVLGEAPGGGMFTYFGRFDAALILSLCSLLETGGGDPRISRLVEFVTSLQDDIGLISHPGYPHLTRWLTLDLYRSLRALQTGDWIGNRPETPYRSYPDDPRRY